MTHDEYLALPPEQQMAARLNALLQVAMTGGDVISPEQDLLPSNNEEQKTPKAPEQKSRFRGNLLVR